MTTSLSDALIFTVVMAIAIFFCRLFPFLFFREKTGTTANATAANGSSVNGDSTNCLEVSGTVSDRRKAAFLNFVEKTVPPAAMTVLAFNALTGPVRTATIELIPALIAAAFTVGVHLWRRNPLISIFGGTALFMILKRVFTSIPF